MDDLAAFLRARLDEDAVSATMREIHAPECESVPLPDGGYTFPCNCGVPERLMREVEAKRAILGEYEAVQRLNASTGQGLSPGLRYRGWLLRHLAAVYSGHPGYRAEWKP